MVGANVESAQEQPERAGDAQSTGIADTIRDEQLELLFAQAPLAIVLSPLAAAALTVAIWDVVNHTFAIGWVVLIATFSLLRMGLLVAFRNRRSDLALKGWERLFTFSLVFVGLIWGVGGWLLLPEEFAYRAMIYFFLIGMASSAVAVYSVNVNVVMLSIFALVFPTTLDFALQESIPERMMAIAVVLFVIAAFRALKITNHFVLRSHSLSNELQRAKEQAETLARTDFLTGMNNRRSFYHLCDPPSNSREDTDRIWPSSCSTSTASRRSTTHTATRSGMTCSGTCRGSSPTHAGIPMSRDAWAVRSSRSSYRTRTQRTPANSRSGFVNKWRSPSFTSSDVTSSSPRASESPKWVPNANPSRR